MDQRVLCRPTVVEVAKRPTHINYIIFVHERRSLPFECFLTPTTPTQINATFPSFWNVFWVGSIAEMNNFNFTTTITPSGELLQLH